MLIQPDPFRDVDALIERLTGRSAEPSWAMGMDAYRRGSDVWVHVDLPGVAADSLDISIERDVLTIAGERASRREEGDQMYLAERPRGSFRRQIHLGEGLDPDHLEADYHDGVLTLRIPVAERAKPRKITVGARTDAIETTSSHQPSA